MTTRTDIHPFEKAGLGKAPFEVVDFSIMRGPIKWVKNGVTCESGAPCQPMGTCDYCGTGIANVYHIMSNDGKRFVVGCECVLKTTGENDPLTRKVKSIKRDNERQARQTKKAERRAIELQKNKIRAEEIISGIDGLREAFEIDHYIIKDIKSRLFAWGSISEAQTALVLKIADQELRKASETFVNVPVEAGRQTIVGKVVSAKWVDSYYGHNQTSDLKGLIVVETPEGNWKTWGTIPGDICDEVVKMDSYSGFEDGVKEAIIGMMIQFDARVKVADNDSSMSFFSRPSKGSILEVK